MMVILISIFCVFRRDVEGKGDTESSDERKRLQEQLEPYWPHAGMVEDEI